ncbi:alpha/beta hydrolase [Mesorhizobium sp. L-8-10]|uniref:alpha/beta fold hydrolase n=1 Tax=Mesorhizobium sp. L-8-10 TaxID=2744523 RepID=UPI001925821C|nr:alpha/beta hydrolase [Mesorhizobium sp. L-8-10]BCH29337.1 alpha/beta hydrolase [Mesorhizobium sp. L-8-10]
MNDLTETSAIIDGIPTRLVLGGEEGAPATLLLHGGSPGLSPYCGGTHLWGDTIARLAHGRRVIAPDLPGSGGTGPADGPLTVGRLSAHARATIEAFAEGPVHLIGHDLGGMVGLWVAIEAPERVASLTIVSSHAASPTGDGVENLALLAPPLPLWSRASQAWAYDRLSYAHHHIDERLLDTSVEAAGRPGHLAYASAQTRSTESELFASIMRAKSRFFRVAREDGVKVPTQIVWARNDPLVTVDHGIWLYRIIAARQRSAHFHLVNRSGNFPFREQPDEFLRLVESFRIGVAGEAA